MGTMRDRLRRLEEGMIARARTASAVRQAALERHCDLINYVREFGVDAPLPAHLVTRDLEEERRTIEWLRSSDSGWDTNPEAIAFLEEWEAGLAK